MRTKVSAIAAVAVVAAMLGWLLGDSDRGESPAVDAVAVGEPEPAADRWAFLRREMSSPRRGSDTACPSAAPRAHEGAGNFAGIGPVYVSTGGDGEIELARRLQWGSFAGEKFAVLIDPGYRGEILVRGAGYFGDAALAFGDGIAPAEEWFLGLEGDASTPGMSPGSRLYVTYLRAEAPGCCYLQLDGLDFGQTVVVLVRGILELE